jgi:hypothetical protein
MAKRRITTKIARRRITTRMARRRITTTIAKILRTILSLGAP